MGRILTHVLAAPVAMSRAGAMARLRQHGTVTRVSTGELVAALTFDDGPHPEYTPRLLDILARHDARATFFVIGERVAAHPEIARRIVNEGHTLANHTWSHALLPGLPSASRRREIRRCAEVIAPLGGVSLFRPPQGRQSAASRRDIRRERHDCIAWSAHVEDWIPQSAQVLAERIAAGLGCGSIVVLHDAIWDPMVPGAEDRGAVLEAVDAVLGRLSDSLRFVTLLELMAIGTPERVAWIQR